MPILLRRAIIGLLYIVPFLPLYVSHSLLFPYVTGRNFIFRLIIEIAAVLWIALVVTDREYRVRLSGPTRALAILVAVFAAADVAGANFYQSFWSSMERMGGLLSLLHMAAFAVMTGSVFRKKEWYVFAHLVVLGSILSGLWGLAQLAGAAPMTQSVGRMYGTLGNPGYFASYLVLSLFLTLVLCLHEQRSGLRRAYLAVILYQAALIYLSQSRGAIVGLAASIPVFVILYLATASGENRKIRRYIWGALLACAALPLLFFAVKDTSFVRSHPTLNRFAKISLKEQTTESRFLIWRMALLGARERPLLGWGQENFNLIFNTYYTPELWKQEPWFDHAHNMVLDWLSDAGILGLLASLFLLASALFAVWKASLKGRISRIVAIAISSGVAAYFVMNLFAFDTFNTAFIIFAWVGYAAFLARGTTVPGAHARRDKRSTQPENAWAIAVLCIGTLVAIWAAYMFNIKPMRAAYDITRGEAYAQARDVDLTQADHLFTAALSRHTFGDREAAQRFVQLMDRVFATPEVPMDLKRTLVEKAVRDTEHVVSRYPDDIRSRLDMADMYAKAATLDSGYTAKAEREYGRVIDFNPSKQIAYIPFITFYLSLERFPEAIAASQRMIAADPSYPDAYFYRTLALVYGKEYRQAEDVLRSQEKVNQFPYFLDVLGAYQYRKNLPAAQVLYEDLTKRYPGNAQYHANLAAVYLKAGAPKEKVLHEGYEAMRLDADKFKDRQTIFQQLGIKP